MFERLADRRQACLGSVLLNAGISCRHQLRHISFSLKNPSILASAAVISLSRKVSADKLFPTARTGASGVGADPE
jgi:hypothetical protein